MKALLPQGGEKCNYLPSKY